MYSVDEIIDQIDRNSDVDDDLERIIEEDHTNDPDRTEDKGDEDEEKKSEKKPRKIGNRPKLNLERLKGPRGLPGMENLFSQIEFKGPGYERQDLAKVMNTLQYWTHRLFPKYSFDDTLEQLERLGTKKPVQTLKTKIVYDMLEQDIPLQDETEIIDEPESEPVNEFDLLMQQGPIPTSLSQRISYSPERVELSAEQKETIERNRLLAIERRNARMEVIKKKQAEQNARFESLSSSQADNNTENSGANSQMELTQNQLEIIERNRKLAIEKRRAKMGFSQSQDVLSDSQPSSSTQTVSLSETNGISQSSNKIVDNSQNDNIIKGKESNNTESSNHNQDKDNTSKVIEVDITLEGIGNAEENEMSQTKSSNNSPGDGDNTKNITANGSDKQDEILTNKAKNNTQILQADYTTELENQNVVENANEGMEVDITQGGIDIENEISKKELNNSQGKSDKQKEIEINRSKNNTQIPQTELENKIVTESANEGMEIDEEIT